MIFEQEKGMEKLGEKAGFIAAYCVFSIVLFIVLSLTKKLGSLTIFHILALTATITLVGVIVKRLLK
jgi:hypothetical protein